MTVDKPTPGNLIATISELVDSVNSGTGVTLGNYSTDYVCSDAAPFIPFDDAQHFPAVITVTPPDWLDGSGNILVPGLYSYVLFCDLGAVPTTQGLYISMTSTFNIENTIAVDSLSFGRWVLSDTQALSSSDLPYLTTNTIRVPADITGAIRVRPCIIRLAY